MFNVYAFDKDIHNRQTDSQTDSTVRCNL